MTILIHPASQKQLDALTKELPQALLLAGETGVGLLMIARQVASTHLQSILQPKTAKGDIDGQNGTITVEAIRQLYEQTRSKHTTRQVIVVDDADRMSTGAQNAFLKLLEEPNDNIHFILTSHIPGGLLPTIRSRLQQVVIHPITPDQTVKHLQYLHIDDPTKQAQLRFIAEGLPAEMTRLVKGADYFQARAKVMTDARQLLQSDNYTQLLIVQPYQDRIAALGLVDSMLLIARRSLSSKPQARLVKQLELLLDIKTSIEANHNARLQLARLVL